MSFVSFVRSLPCPACLPASQRQEVCEVVSGVGKVGKVRGGKKGGGVVANACKCSLKLLPLLPLPSSVLDPRYVSKVR